MKLYKLTDQNHRTRAGESNECQWGENITHSGTGEGELCGPGWIHAYTDPLLAVMFNPIHANIKSPILWESEGDVVLDDHGVKVGCLSLTTLRIVPLPEVSTNQLVAFGILCAMQVYRDPKFLKWADGWLAGTDRSAYTAAAAAAAYPAAAAAYAAATAYTATTYTATYAAYTAAAAAEVDCDLIGLARQAMEVLP